MNFIACYSLNLYLQLLNKFIQLSNLLLKNKNIKTHKHTTDRTNVLIHYIKYVLLLFNNYLLVKNQSIVRNVPL